ncbi:2717_t:CDS:2 [Ambispora gerdemannii]|uniref:2717_t:CDS:1 n=1 Tax=Ambispora gerdemannii TaxID=144530 RepID=A0A9N9FBX8_9GLOM|nr:2717_t:CDS:2 [Ambispora gerdemannii]
MQRPAEFTNREAGGGDEGCCESGDKSILHKFSPRQQSTSGSTQSKMSTTPHLGGNLHQIHPYLTQTSDNSSFIPSSPQKGGGVAATLNTINQTNGLTREQIEGAAAVLAQLATTPSKDTSYLNVFQSPGNATKYLEEKPQLSQLPSQYHQQQQQIPPSKKHLKRSVSFNHSSRPTSPRQQTTSASSYIDVAEVLATTVSLVRENNRKLDKITDEVRSESNPSNSDGIGDGNFSDNEDVDYWSEEGPEDDYEDYAGNAAPYNRNIANEILTLSNQMENMEYKYREQLVGKEKLIKELEIAFRESDKDSRLKAAEIKRLEQQLDASRRAITELVEQQQRESESMQNQGPDAQTTETIRQMEAELRAKSKTIAELNKRITVTARQVSDSKEKEKKLEALTNQVSRYQTLESEWKGLTSQLETLHQREVELHEKEALIESLNIRLDTSQQVIAELREKHAPHDLLRQLRQKDYIIDNLTQQVENIDADLKEKDDEIEALASKLAEQAKLMEKLREQNSQLIPLRARAEETEQRLRQQLIEKERECHESSRLVENSGEKLRAQDKTINTLRQDVVELRRELTTQSSENREKERLIVNMHEETLHVRTNFQGLLNVLSEKDQKIQQLDQHIESLQQQAAAAAAKNQIAVGGVKDSKNNKNEVRLNALQKVLNTKIEACRDYEKKISQLEEDFGNLKKQMDDNKTSVSEKDIKIQRLVKMNRELKEEVTQIKEKMEEKEKELITIKSRIPTPAPGSAPAASIRATSNYVRSRVSSMYSLSGGESSGDEAKIGGRLRKAVSLSGLESPLRARSITNSSITSRRLSDASKRSSISSRLSTSSTALVSSRTKASTSTSDRESAFKKTAASTKLAVKPQAKPRVPPIKPTSTVDVLKKVPKKEVSPINRSAVTQRKRDMVVLTNMLSGVTSDRKNRVPTPAQKRATSAAIASSSSSLTNSKKKLTDNAASSDSDSERVKRTVASRASTLKKPNSNLATIVERIRKGDDTSVTLTTTTQGSSSNNSNAAGKQRTSLVRPLPSRKPSSSA